MTCVMYLEMFEQEKIRQYKEQKGYNVAIALIV